MAMFGSPLGMTPKYKYYDSYKSKALAENAVRVIRRNANVEDIESYRIERDLSGRYGESTYSLYIKLRVNKPFAREKRGIQAP